MAFRLISEQLLDSNGDPLSGGKVYVYEPGTTTPKNSYPTAANADAGTSPNTNPVILNAAGRAQIWGQDGEIYKLVINASDDTLVATIDNIASEGGWVLTSLASTTTGAEGSSLVGHKSSATGAVGTTVKKKIDERKSVKDFGALGDDDNDDTGEFNLAGASGAGQIDVPAGTYLLSAQPDIDLPMIFDREAFFHDANTDELFLPQFTMRQPDLRNAWADKEKRSIIDGYAPTIVMYGDSNTRYYRGDSAAAGPHSRSFGQFLDYMIGRHPSLWGATVTVNGYPGEDVAYGVTNFATNVTGANADVVVLGFGTNDIKLTGASMDTYLASMRELIELCLSNDVMPIVLGIPYYDAAYGDDGLTSQQRIPVWNNRLHALTVEYGIDFIDTYSAFKEFPSVFFNEATLHRHYNQVATRWIAAKIIEILERRSTLGAMVRPAVYRETFNVAEMPELIEGKSITFEQYTIAGKQIAVMKIPSGSTITLRGAGRFCLGFYPRATATADLVSGAFSDSISLTATVDGTEFYQVHRYASTTSFDGTAYDLDITATSGDLFLRFYAFEEPVVAATATYTSGHMARVTAANLPTNPVPTRWYYVTDLAKPVTWDTANSIWVDASGYQAVGTTAQKTAVQGNVAHGFKFYDTDLADVYRWNIDTDTWTAI